MSGASTLAGYCYLKQLPVFPPALYELACPWSPGERLADWFRPRVVELTYTSCDIASFTRYYGYDGPPFRWDEARGFLLRAELDAAFFHLYGIGREDVDYILETFPIVKQDDEKRSGEYRIKRVILERYDALAQASTTGTPYQTVLDLPPADPLCAHPLRCPPEP